VKRFFIVDLTRLRPVDLVDWGVLTVRHPERSEGSHINLATHTSLHCVINQLAGGPSPSSQLEMTAL
jgi:hypothetical protein